MQPISLNICNINTVIKISGHTSFSKIVKERYREFTTRNRSNQVDLYLDFRLSGERSNTIINRPEVIIRCNRYHFSGPGYECTAVKRSGVWTAQAAIPANIYLFDTVMRVLWSLLLIERNSFLIHSCGIADGASAYLFPGRSGAGKTTMARKAGRARVLSDELVCVRVTPDRCYATGTPFWGEFRKGGRPISRPLRGIYFLRKSPLTRPVKISDRLAFRKMLKLVLFFGRDADNTGKLLKLISKCLLQTDCYILNLTQDAKIGEIMGLLLNSCEKRARRSKSVIPAKAGIQTSRKYWIPACAGMTERAFRKSSVY